MLKAKLNISISVLYPHSQLMCIAYKEKCH
jgi:hypothetical protein